MKSSGTPEKNEAWVGLFFIIMGVMIITLLLTILGSGHWYFMVLGGVGWLLGPLFILIGSCSIYRGIRGR